MMQKNCNIIDRDYNQKQTDVLFVVGRVSEAQTVKALSSSGKGGGEQQLICI